MGIPEFNQLLTQHPTLAAAMLRVMATRLRATTTFAVEHAPKDVDRRLAATLVELAITRGVEEGTIVMLDVTQGELAGMLRVDPESMSGAIKRLRARRARAAGATLAPRRQHPRPRRWRDPEGGVAEGYGHGVTVFGVHAGLQNTSMASLRALWRRIEDLGFDWISIWDHFYSADFTEDGECHEAVATHAALACDTTNVRCGSLVYSRRLPASGGAGERHRDDRPPERRAGRHRARRGLGHNEYDAYGIPFPAVKVRLDLLEEAMQCVRGLLRDEVDDFKGEYFTAARRAAATRSRCSRALPIWIGGRR